MWASLAFISVEYNVFLLNYGPTLGCAFMQMGWLLGLERGSEDFQPKNFPATSSFTEVRQAEVEFDLKLRKSSS